MNRSKKIAIITLSSALVLLLAVFLISYLYWANNHKSELPMNSRIGNIDLSGKTPEQAKKLIDDKIEEAIKTGINFEYGGKSATLPLVSEALSADIPDAGLKYSDAISYNNEATKEYILSSGGGNFLRYIASFLPFREREIKYEAYFSYSPEIIEEWLVASFPEASIKPEPAYFSLETKNGQPTIINNQEKIGKEINLEEVFKNLEEKLSNLSDAPIKINTKSQYPNIKQSDLEPLRNEVDNLVKTDGFNVYIIDQSNGRRLEWKISGKNLITWVSADKDAGKIKLDFNQEKIQEYLKDKIAIDINQEAVLPRFEMNNGKVSSWQSGKNGRELDLEKSAVAITESLLVGQKEAQLLINEVDVKKIANGENFNVTELLGTGHSNFAGSPSNRRHNIKVGAEAVHGMLIKPGEEFSLVSALGEIDASSGYLPELVIKGNKTIPEYGGGLCQVATTLFRAALSSGLPITARRNHSYRVSYYEPAGTDAAVYDPWPDVKFLNDTNDYVLIQARIEGNDAYFEFWGTKDGRIATTTPPVIFNIVKPAPTKIIETDELRPGEKKCTEKAHNGADAYFDYIVIYPEGSTTTPRQEVRFKSHYVPWQEVCLVGKSAPTASSSEAVASSTPKE